jgi:hypothetical protein
MRPSRLVVAVVAALTAVLIGAGLAAFGAVQLARSGSATPSRHAAASTTTVAPAPASTTTTSLSGTRIPDQAARCSVIPTSQAVPGFLHLGVPTSAGPSRDPRTGAPTRRVTATLTGSMLSPTAPFDLVAIVSVPGSAPDAGASSPIDRAGERQLYLTYDGHTKHKAVRTLVNGSWTVQSDTEAGSLTLVISATTVSFYWTGLAPGDELGFVVASGGGCATAGLDANLQPTIPLAG